jgi:hypothetical protein
MWYFMRISFFVIIRHITLLPPPPKALLQIPLTVGMWIPFPSLSFRIEGEPLLTLSLPQMG